MYRRLDPHFGYPVMMRQDLSDPEAQWETVAVRQLGLQEEGGGTRREKYGK